MKHINNFINEKLVINKNIKVQHYNYQPKDKKELRDIVKKLIKERGNNADLNDIDTSEITAMSQVFCYSKFDGNISKWDVSKVRTMEEMFAFSKFTGKNGDISKWDVSNVRTMKDMFYRCPLEKNPPKWYKK